MEQIQKYFDDEKLLETDVVWKIGLKGWVPVSKVISKKIISAIIPQKQVEEIIPPPIPESNSKKTGLFSLKILAIFPILFIILAAYFLFPRKIDTKLPFSQLPSNIYDQISEKLSSGKSVNELILSKDSREIWFATTKTGTYKAELSLKSIEGQILGEREVALISKTQITKNWARFYTFELEKGTKIIPGIYAYNLKLIPVGSKSDFNYLISKFIPFLSDPKFEESFYGTILFSPDTKEIFQKKLEDYKAKFKEAMEKPFKDKLEKWQAYLSILNKINILLQDELKTITNGSQIVGVEKKYLEFLGPMLSQLVIETNGIAKDLSSTSAEKSLEYEKLYLFGKEIGETFSSLVLRIKKIKKITAKDRLDLSKKTFEAFEGLRRNIDSELSRVQDELERLPL